MKFQNKLLYSLLALWATICIISFLKAFVYDDRPSPRPRQLARYPPPKKPEPEDFYLTESEIENFETTFTMRKRRIDHACTLINDAESEIAPATNVPSMDLMIDNNTSLAWCPIYKAASIIWMNNFAKQSGHAEPENLRDSGPMDPHLEKIVKEKYKYAGTVEQLNAIIKLMTRIMVVRHPFERLLSAYRDKLENRQDQEYYYERYGKRIVENYRPKSSMERRAEPTFAEFLSFIAAEADFDDYWMPYYSACQPCSINYDYVMKFEYQPHEYNYFVFIANMQQFNYTYVEQPRRHDLKGPTNLRVAEQYFRNVPITLLYKIYDIYKLDFTLFNYSPRLYYLMSANNTLGVADDEIHNF